MRSVLLAALGCAMLVAAPLHARSGAGSADTAIKAAVAQSSRPADAVALDASRHPAEVLVFLGLKPGMHAADIMTGSGYWAEIMAGVVGPKGKVHAYEPQQFYTAPEELQKWNALTARRPDVDWQRYPFESFAAPANAFDFTIINLSYHDLYWQSEKYKIPRTDPDAFVKALFAATKPGGIVGIVDHVGGGMETRALVDKLHRIDPAVVKADFERAGFVLEAQSSLLANPADDHSMLVFNPAIRGKTDRFLYRFRKPARR